MIESPRKTPPILITLCLLLIAIPFYSATVPLIINKESAKIVIPVIDSSANLDEGPSSLYDKLQLDETGLSRDAFEYAIKGYEYLRDEGKLQNNRILTIIDFSKPSDQKRMYVLDVEDYKLLYHTYVAHGRNSGNKYATHFSNRPGSHMSSLGFYVTASTYYGDNGYSLRLKGEEKGINDNAFSRAIVIHCADYVSASYVKNRGYAGRSYGCPALPRKVSKPIIQTIKDGSCLFIYAPSENYIAHSRVL